MDSTTPVIVGAAQLVQRVDDLAEAREAAELMTDAVRAAAVDSGADNIAARAGLVVTIKGAWSYRDPSRIVADAVGATNARTALTADGGNTPQLIVDVLAERISRGELDVAIIIGAETIWSRRRMRSSGVQRDVTAQLEDVKPDELLGRDLVLGDDFEHSRGLNLPVDIYPLFESAIRHRRGETPDVHRDRLAKMWADFNAVAVDNPYAWFRTPMSADDIRDPSPSNRMVAFPYTKAMCSNWDVDQAAAIIMCSAEAASAAGVPRDRWVYPYGGAEADDTALVSHRDELGRSPAIAAAWRALSAQCRLGIDDIAHLDVYSCFPSAVQASIEAIGIDESRRLTVTGGLTFAGGPLNNYVSHSIAAMVGVLREDPAARGLVTANGGFITKHALGIYSATPPTVPFGRTSLGDADVQHQPRAVAPDATGTLDIEAYTVMHDHNGPSRALVGFRTPDDRRTWGFSQDSDVMQSLLASDHVGSPATLDGEGHVHLG